MDTRHKNPPWVIVIILVAFICLISYLAALIINKTGRSEFGSYKTISAPGAEVKLAGDGFVMYDGSTIEYVDSSGSIVWSYLLGAGYEFSASGSGIAAWSGKTLTIIDAGSGTTVYSAQQSGDIKFARVGSKYAASLIEDGDNASVTVIETGGREVFAADFIQLTVIDFGFYSSGTRMWVMALDTTGSVPTCEITSYRPSNKSIIGSISDTEQLTYAISFEAEGLRATGDTYSKIYDYTGTELTARRALVYGWYLYSADRADNALCAFVPTAQGEAQNEIRDVRMLRQGLDRTVRMPFGCISVVSKGDSVFGFSRDGYIMIASAGSQRVNSYDMPFTIDEVCGVTDSYRAVVKSGANIYIVNLSAE